MKRFLLASLTFVLLVGSVGGSVFLSAANENTALAAQSSPVQPTGVAVSSAALPSAITPGVLPAAPQCEDAFCRAWGANHWLTPEQQAALQAERASISNYLLVNRWRDATAQFQNKYDIWAIGDLMNAASRTMIQGNVMGIGNGFWVLNQWTAELAINFEPIAAFGFQLDQVGAQLGTALLNPSSGIAVIPLAAVVVLLIWMFSSWRKSGGNAGQLFKRIAGLIGTVALFAIMVNGASNSTQTAATYNPGVGSPGWIITSANDALTTAATAPVGAILAATQAQQSQALVTDGANLCAESTNYYDQKFRSAFNANVLSTPRIAVTQTMDSMWRTTGLAVWKNTQFGTSSYADYSYCRLLDFWTQQPQNNAAEFTAATGIPSTVSGTNQQLVWAPGNGEQVQRMMVGWAACMPNDRSAGSWTLRPGWVDIESIDKTNECNKWWDRKLSDREFESGFSVGYTMGDIAEKTKNVSADYRPAISDYLASLNGANAAGALFPLLLYSFSAFIMMFVFFGLAIAVVLAKFFVVLGTLTIFPVLLLALFRPNGGEAVGAAMKQFLGSMIFAATALVMLSVVVLLTHIMVNFGNTSFGVGTVAAMSWSAAAPLLSLIALNMVFKKVLKMPSPFSMKGGMAYGMAAGAAGGAVGGFVGGRMAKRAIERAGSNAMRGAASSAIHKATGGRMGTTSGGRRSMMGGMMGSGAATRMAGGGGVGGGAGAQGQGTRAERRIAARRERMEARIHNRDASASQREQRRAAAGITVGARGGIRGRMEDYGERALNATRERGQAMWNGVKAKGETLRHPIQHLRADDLRASYTEDDGTFDEAGFRLARQARIKGELKTAAKVGAVVAGGVMTAGSSWAIGAAAVGATYATGKATGKAFSTTRHAAGTSKRRLEAYRDYQHEQAEIQAEAERQAKQQNQQARYSPGSGGTPPPVGGRPRPTAKGSAKPRATGKPVNKPKPPTP